MDFPRFGSKDDDPRGERDTPSNPLIDALEQAHEDALKLNLSAAEYGNRIIAALGEASREEISEATEYLAQAMGKATPTDARMAAIERLTEMRAAGKVGKEDFDREMKRLSQY